MCRASSKSGGEAIFVEGGVETAGCDFPGVQGGSGGAAGRVNAGEEMFGAEVIVRWVRAASEARTTARRAWSQDRSNTIHHSFGDCTGCVWACIEYPVTGRGIRCTSNPLSRHGVRLGRTLDIASDPLIPLTDYSTDGILWGVIVDMPEDFFAYLDRLEEQVEGGDGHAVRVLAHVTAALDLAAREEPPPVDLPGLPAVAG